MVEREGRRNGVGGEYPCLCAKTVALAVKCSYVGHANEGRYVLRCNPKCVEPSAPSPLCFFIVKKARQPFFFTLLGGRRRRSLSNGNALPACTHRAAVDSHLIETLLILAVSVRFVAIDHLFFNASRIDFDKVAAVRFLRLFRKFMPSIVPLSVLPLVYFRN